MTETAAAVVRQQIMVEAPPERAFAVCTERFGDFKLGEHNLLRVPIVKAVFEPKAGGHIYDVGEDGSECRCARILAYEPPGRMAALPQPLCEPAERIWLGRTSSRA